MGLHIVVFTSLVISLQWLMQSNMSSFLNRFEFLLYDMRMQLASYIDYAEYERKNVVVIDIDEKSLKQEGRWPWSRNRMADLVDRLVDYGVPVVAFDVVFSESEAEVLLKTINNSGMNENQTNLFKKSFDSWNPDKKLGQSLGNIDSILGFFLHPNHDIKVGKIRHPIAEVPNNNVLIQAQGFTAAVQDIQEKSTMDGFVTTFFDIDGVIRRTPLIMNYKGQAYPSLAVAATMSYLLIDDLGIDFKSVGDVADLSQVKITDTPIRTDAVGRVLVPYKKAENHFDYISAADIFNDEVDADLLFGKIAFVGTSAIGLADLINTPFTTGFPGVGVHAIVAQNILDGEFPFRPVWMPGAILILQIFLVLAYMWLFKDRRPLVMVSLGVLSLILIFGIDLWVWMRWKIDTPILSIVVLTVMMFFWYLISGFLDRYKMELKIKDMFGQYAPPAHIDKMLNNPDMYNMDGESKELTVLFADIRSFTSISEKLTASELKQYLNTFFTPITESIFNNKGTIDKYVGDMVMAFWGAPIDDADHKMNAIRTALIMQKISAAISDKMVAEGYPKLDIGIGLNSGFMNVGDMGSQYRKSYTVLGDAVNLGSRLEGLTKYYGAQILVGENTAEGMSQVAFRLCDLIRVKGKDIPIQAYEPIGFYEDLEPDVLSHLQQYHQALDFYRAQRWDSAMEILKALQESDENRRIYSLYLERIEINRDMILPDNWDGVFTHTNK